MERGQGGKLLGPSSLLIFKILARRDDSTSARGIEADASVLRCFFHPYTVAEMWQKYRIDRLRSGTYDVVLCDLGMPGMNGWEVARQAREIAPGVKFYLITGWARTVQLEMDHSVEISGVFSKPLDLAEITRLVATLNLGLDQMTKK